MVIEQDLEELEGITLPIYRPRNLNALIGANLMPHVEPSWVECDCLIDRRRYWSVTTHKQPLPKTVLHPVRSAPVHDLQPRPTLTTFTHG